MRIFVIFQLPVITIIWGSLAGFTNGKKHRIKDHEYKNICFAESRNKQYFF